VIVLIKGLYIHLPFCKQICSYCDFSKLVAKRELKEAYLLALQKELEFRKPLLEGIETVYLGGGTPSCLETPLFKMLLKMISRLKAMSKVVEFTIEANPEDIDIEKVDLMLDAGVTRISLGVQTFALEILEKMQREGGFDTVSQAVRLLREKGFVDINIDMIYGYPGQNLQIIANDLRFLLGLEPDHVSYYSLILEARTVLSHLVKNKVVTMPLEDDVCDQSELVVQTLETHGYNRYEISNFAREGHEARHNRLYWQLQEYLGIGLKAASQFDNHRYVNPLKISEYISEVNMHGVPKQTIETFEPEKEFVILGLRLREGIELSAFEKRFLVPLFKVFPGLEQHLDNGLLELTKSHLRFTKRGFDLANQVYLAVI